MIRVNDEFSFPSLEQVQIPKPRRYWKNNLPETRIAVITTVSDTAMSRDWLLNDPVVIFEPENNCTNFSGEK